MYRRNKALLVEWGFNPHNKDICPALYQAKTRTSSCVFEGVG